MELGKELAVCHAPPFSVDVRCHVWLWGHFIPKPVKWIEHCQTLSARCHNPQSNNFNKLKMQKMTFFKIEKELKIAANNQLCLLLVSLDSCTRPLRTASAQTTCCFQFYKVGQVGNIFPDSSTPPPPPTLLLPPGLHFLRSCPTASRVRP